MILLELDKSSCPHLEAASGFDASGFGRGNYAACLRQYSRPRSGSKECTESARILPRFSHISRCVISALRNKMLRFNTTAVTVGLRSVYRKNTAKHVCTTKSARSSINDDAAAVTSADSRSTPNSPVCFALTTPTQTPGTRWPCCCSSSSSSYLRFWKEQRQRNGARSTLLLQSYELPKGH